MDLTPEQWKHFKRKYKEAKDAGKNSFDFMDNEVLVAYAKYLLEWQEGKEK